MSKPYQIVSSIVGGRDDCPSILAKGRHNLHNYCDPDRGSIYAYKQAGVRCTECGGVALPANPNTKLKTDYIICCDFAGCSYCGGEGGIHDVVEVKP